MTMTNIQLNDIRENFESKYGKKGSTIQTVWNRITHIAGNSFLTMNDEELQQFFITEVIYDEMETSTKDVYKSVYKKIVSYLKNNGYINADFRKWKHQTKLVHIPRNKDNKTKDSDSDKLCERISSLKKSMNSTEQEINSTEQEMKDLGQKLEKLRNKLACDKYRLAKFERVKKDFNRVQKESKRVQEEVKEVLSY